MLPHEKGLVKLLEDKPFALLGINSDLPPDLDKQLTTFDQKLEPVRKYVKGEVLDKNGITWRQAIDCGTDGPLATRWNISGWPTIFVIDAQGVIRYRDVRDEAMTKAVDTLLAEISASPPAPAKK
jgi:hypothetical protein